MNKLNEKWKKDFEIYKEEKRQEDMLNNKLLTEISTRASIVPYFNIVLDDNRIKKKNEELNKLNEKWKKDFEIYKEEKRQEDMLNNKLLTEISTRASIVPYFNIVLDDNRIKKRRRIFDFRGWSY